MSQAVEVVQAVVQAEVQAVRRVQHTSGWLLILPPLACVAMRLYCLDNTVNSKIVLSLTVTALSNSLVSNSLVSYSLVSNSLVSKSLVSNSLVSNSSSASCGFFRPYVESRAPRRRVCELHERAARGARG